MNPIELKSKLTQEDKSSPFWILGPCVLEHRDTTAKVAETIKSISEKLDIPVVFKASFDKANRTSVSSYRGPGIQEGLLELEWVKKNFELPLLTDIHETHQASAVGEVVDILQIPAFLCRQTSLLEAASKTGKLVNLKKGQFIAPSNVEQMVKKLEEFDSSGFWITERGASFGYGRLVVDFAAFPEMEKAGASMILDITHSVQLPGSNQGVTGGIREAIPYLARAGAAVGVSGFFAETHPIPAESKSDAANAWPLDQLESLMKKTKEIAQTTHG